MRLDPCKSPSLLLLLYFTLEILFFSTPSVHSNIALSRSSRVLRVTSSPPFRPLRLTLTPFPRSERFSVAVHAINPRRRRRIFEINSRPKINSHEVPQPPPPPLPPPSPPPPPQQVVTPVSRTEIKLANPPLSRGRLRSLRNHDSDSLSPGCLSAFLPSFCPPSLPSPVPCTVYLT